MTSLIALALSIRHGAQSWHSSSDRFLPLITQVTQRLQANVLLIPGYPLSSSCIITRARSLVASRIISPFPVCSFHEASKHILIWTLYCHALKFYHFGIKLLLRDGVRYLLHHFHRPRIWMFLSQAGLSWNTQTYISSTATSCSNVTNVLTTRNPSSFWDLWHLLNFRNHWRYSACYFQSIFG